MQVAQLRRTGDAGADPQAQVDTKGGGELVSRLGVRRKADLLIPPETDVFEAVRTATLTVRRWPACCATRASFSLRSRQNSCSW